MTVGGTLYKFSSENTSLIYTMALGEARSGSIFVVPPAHIFKLAIKQRNCHWVLKWDCLFKINDVVTAVINILLNFLIKILLFTFMMRLVMKRFPVNSYSSQFVLKSIRTHFGQFVLKILVNSYSFGQFVLMSGQFVLILVNSYSFWSIRTQTQMSRTQTQMSTN